MKEILIFIGVIAILVLIGFFFYQDLLKIGEKLSTREKQIMPEKVLEGKKAAIIIAYKDFRDEEYFVPKEILEAAGVKIKNVSTQMGQALGADGGQVKIDLLVKDLNPADFDAIIFIGGPGCLKYLDNEDSYRVAKETVSQRKLMAAICISPVILAKAGALEGKKATVWSSILDKSAIKTLEEKGAMYQDKDVVADGHILTANGPAAASKFGEAIIDLLK